MLRIYSRPNGWTDWAYIFCGHSWVAGGCYRLKDFDIFFNFFSKFLFFNFFPHGQRRTLQLASNLYNKTRYSYICCV